MKAEPTFSKLTEQLFLYQKLSADPLVKALAESNRALAEEGKADAAGRTSAEPARVWDAELRSALYELLRVSEAEGFHGNLWQCYFTRLLASDENPFSLACERRTLPDGSLRALGRAECETLRALFFTDFSKMDAASFPAGFPQLLSYQRPECAEQDDSGKTVGAKRVLALCQALSRTDSADAFFEVLTKFYKTYGTGIYALANAFRVDDGKIVPVSNEQNIALSDLIGYELQKQKLFDNTAAFCAGKPANNVLLYGDSGTGKSTAVRAVLHQLSGEGLRLIELDRYQFSALPRILTEIAGRGCRFLIYLDDLSFETFETEYKYLKAVIEGGANGRPENVLIYATSNRRHLIREELSDRSDMEHGEDVHRSDTLEEKLSLASRFGLAICFTRPDRQRFYDMAIRLARKAGISAKKLDDEALCAEANRFVMRGGGLSGRTARQFVDWLLGTFDFDHA